MRYVVLLAVTLGSFGYLARPLVRNQVPLEYDLGKYHLPLRDFYQKCLRNGDDPAWCPQLFCGYDCHGEGQGGFDHPWHRLLYWCLPLTVAFNIEIFANYPFLFAGMYLFLRRFDLPRDAAWAGAFAATFSGFTLPHYVHTNAIAIVAHIPWLLWATDVLWRDTDRGHRALAGLAIALLTGSQILLGYPQYVYFSSLAEGVYVLCLLFERPPARIFSSPSPPGFAGGEGGVRGDSAGIPLTPTLSPEAGEREKEKSICRWTLTISWSLFKLLGIAIGGAQLLPSLEALSLSPRLGYDPSFRGMLSLPPAMLLQIVAPSMFNEHMQHHEYAVYGGALATLGFLFFSLSPRALTGGEGGVRGVFPGDTLNQWAFWMIVIAVPLALGKYTPLFKLYLKLPIVGVFRCPCRYLILSHLASAVVVARMVQVVGRRQTSEVSEDFRSRKSQRSVWALLAVPVLALTVVSVVATWPDVLPQETHQFLAPPERARQGVVFLTAATLALLVAIRGHSWALPLLLVIGLIDQAAWGFRAIDVHTFTDIETYKNAQNPPPGEPTGRIATSDTDGDGLMLLGWSYTSGYIGLTPQRSLDYSKEETLRLAAARWQLTGHNWRPIDGLPRVRFATPSGEIQVVVDRPGLLRVLTNADASQQLVFAESYHPSWRVEVDGTPAQLTHADTDFLGVTLSAGQHHVRFKFDPASRTWGRRLSSAGLLAAILLALWLGRRTTTTMT